MKKIKLFHTHNKKKRKHTETFQGDCKSIFDWVAIFGRENLGRLVENKYKTSLLSFVYFSSCLLFLCVFKLLFFRYM